MPASVSPVFDGYVDAQLIKNGEPNFHNGTNLALEERQITIADGIVLASLIAVAALVITLILLSGVKGDRTVSSSLMHLVLLSSVDCDSAS
jgi:hypothetical protein